MTGSLIFWAIAIALLAAVAAVLLAPLRRSRAVRSRAESDVAVYRDQLAEIDRDLSRGLIGEAEAEAARAEVARRLLAADEAREKEEGASPLRPWRVALPLLVLVPAVTLALYLVEGAPGLPSQPYAERMAKAPEDQSIEELVARVEEHLRANPNDAEGWKLIAPIYTRLGRYEDAGDAYARLVQLEGATAQRLADLGEARVFANDGLVSEQARDTFLRALEIDGSNPQARYFLGLAALQQGDRESAREIWQALVDESPEDAPWRQMLERSLVALDDDSPAATPQGAGIAALPEAERAAAIEGMVDGLDTRLAEQGGSDAEWIQLLRARMVLGQPERAREVLGRAREAFADDEEARARIDAVAEELGVTG